MAHNLLRHRSEDKSRSRDAATPATQKAREFEADALGARIARSAGFAPTGAETFLRRIAVLRGPMVATTHPTYAARIARLNLGKSAP
jgi:predicted Zn-dependent protease